MVRNTMAGKISARKQAVRNNHACSFCRARKVKCDGVHPECGLCRSENVHCTYEQDRRQISRVSPAVVQRMADQLAEMGERLKKLDYHIAQKQSSQLRTLSDTTMSILSPLRASTQAIDDVFAGTSPSQDLESILFHAPESALCPSDNQAISVEIHTGVENDGGQISVYGPSSIFNPSLSHASHHQSHSPRRATRSSRNTPGLSQNNIDDIVAEKARLFANSALQFQKEWTYMTERKFDLDGLDFDTAWNLLQLHWNHHHQAYLITYRPAIMHSLATNGPYVNKLLLNAIFLASALIIDREELNDGATGRQSLIARFFSRIQQLTVAELERSSVASAVAFNIISSSLVSRGYQTAGWHYSGLGYRMIIDLGLHVDSHKVHLTHSDPSQTVHSFTEVDRELHRRVYWGAYINDKFQSLYFGRQPALMTSGAEPSRECLDTFEELELWEPSVDSTSPVSPSTYEPQPAYTVSTFHSFICLADIMGGILTSLYSPQAQSQSKDRILESTGELQKCLERWRLNLPTHLQYDPSWRKAPPAHRFNPPMTFHMLHILLHRPFLQEGHLWHLRNMNNNAHSEICLSSAIQIYELAKAYRDNFTLRRATYMFSYCLICAASVIPFAASDSDDPSQRHMTGWFWIALKELQNGANFGMRRPIMIIRSLIEHAGLDLDSILAQTTGLGTGTRPVYGTKSHLDHGDIRVPDVEDESGLPPAQNLDPDAQVDVLEDRDFQRLCQDLFSRDIDGRAAPQENGFYEDALLYGLFRQT